MPRPFRLPLDGPVLSAALGSIAAVGAMVVTLQGLLLGADSATYLAAARGARLDPWTLLHPPSGTDLTLRGHFPPAYSALVALVGGPGGARVLGVVLAAVTVTLLCEIVRRHAGAGAALVAGALLICTRDHLLVMFGFLQSDGLHLAATTATVACALAALPTTEPRTTEPRTTGAHLTGAHHPDAGRRRVLAAVAMFGAIATLTRYTGIGVLVGAAAALVHGRGVRVRSALLTIAAGLAPLIVWTAIVAGSGEWSSRRVGWTRVGLDPWAAIDGLILSYAPAAILDGIPGVASRSVALVSFVAICWWSAHAIRRGASPIATLLIVAWSYLAVIVASRLTLDRNIVLHGRFIIPWQILLQASLAIEVGRRFPRWPTWRRVATLATVGALLLSGTTLFARTLREPTAAWWNVQQADTSALRRLLRPLPRDQVVVTNEEALVYLGTGRRTARLPAPTDPFDWTRNPAFATERADMIRAVRRGDAVVHVRGRSADLAALRLLDDLVVVARDGDDTLFGPPPG